MNPTLYRLLGFGLLTTLTLGTIQHISIVLGDRTSVEDRRFSFVGCIVNGLFIWFVIEALRRV